MNYFRHVRLIMDAPETPASPVVDTFDIEKEIADMHSAMDRAAAQSRRFPGQVRMPGYLHLFEERLGPVREVCTAAEKEIARARRLGNLSVSEVNSRFEAVAAYAQSLGVSEDIARDARQIVLGQSS